MAPLAAFLPGAGNPPMSKEAFLKEEADFRAARERKLTSPDGWLAVAGLNWLHDGATVVGSDPKSDIVLPASGPRRAGTLRMQSGAVTFLTKETPDEALVHTIREVHSGGRPIPPEIARKLADRLTQSQLTAREVEVLTLVAKGLRNKEIAAALAISEETVQGHM